MSRSVESSIEEQLRARSAPLEFGRRRRWLDAPRARAIACAASASLGIAFAVAIFYPGYMSPDSIEQLSQARSALFTDWHPPLISFLWHFTDRVLPGPGGMLLLNNVLFWSAAALICYHCLHRTAPLITLAVGLFPPVFGLLSTVWKDVTFGAAMVLAFALLLHAQLTRSRAAWAFSFLPLLYALAARHNSPPAVYALALYGGWIFWRVIRGIASWRFAFATGSLSFLVLLASVILINRQLVADRRMHIEQTILLHDLTAISLDRQAVLLPKWVRRDGSTPTLEELRSIYHPFGLVSLFCCDPKVSLEQTTDPSALATLRRLWATAIYHHFGAYLRHRWKVFLGILGTAHSCYPYHDGISDNSLGVTFRSTRVNRIVMEVLSTLGNSVLFRPWLYLCVIVLLLVGSIWVSPNFRAPALALGSSALAYEVAYLWVGPSCDFRLSWYLALAALLMPLLFVGALGTRRRSMERPDAQG